MNSVIRQSFLAELEKIAQAKTLGAGLLSLAGKPRWASAYNNLYSKRLSNLLQYEIPGTKGMHLPYPTMSLVPSSVKLPGTNIALPRGVNFGMSRMTPDKVKALSDQLSHPETAAQILVPGSWAHMPAAEVVKRYLPSATKAVV